MARAKKPKRFKVLSRLNQDQKARLLKLVQRADGRAGQTDFMSAAFELYDWAAARYPIGLNLLPQIPELVNEKKRSPSRAKKGKP